MELLLGFLHNPKYHIRPVLECCRDVLYPLSKEVPWGYSIPYMITGQMNEHPRSAIKQREGDQKNALTAFYDEMHDQ